MARHSTADPPAPWNGCAIGVQSGLPMPPRGRLSDDEPHRRLSVRHWQRTCKIALAIESGLTFQKMEQSEQQQCRTIGPDI
ncbi:hypothetical protein GCM10017624_17390 [Azotobacter vinelandii]|nr:hypothetical protein GCM10017624_17390 [Azotobacter vinelandii]